MSGDNWNNFKCPVCQTPLSATDRGLIAFVARATRVGSVGITDNDGIWKLGCGHFADAIIDRTQAHDRFNVQLRARATSTV